MADNLDKLSDAELTKRYQATVSKQSDGLDKLSDEELAQRYQSTIEKTPKLPQEPDKNPFQLGLEVVGDTISTTGKDIMGLGNQVAIGAGQGLQELADAAVFPAMRKAAGPMPATDLTSEMKAAYPQAGDTESRRPILSGLAHGIGYTAPTAPAFGMGAKLATKAAPIALQAAGPVGAADERARE